MNIVLHLESLFDCVYSINGVFLENAQNIRYQDNQIMYITVYPLKAMYLPYTVKMIGGKVISNKDLCASYALPNEHFYVKFKSRLNYVYSPVERYNNNTEIQSIVNRFFSQIKNGDIAAARQSMTPTLSSGIADADIADFFDKYVDIIPNKFFEDSKEHSYFLVDKAGKCEEYQFILQDGYVDNIKFCE